MVFNSVILPSVLVPAGAALLALLLLGIPRARHQRVHPFSAPRGGALSLAAAFMAAYVAMAGLPRFPPVEATQRLFFLVLVALIVSFAIAKLSDRKRLIAFGLFAIPVLVALLQSQIEHRWSSALTIGWTAALTAVALLVDWAWARSIEEDMEDSLPSRPDDANQKSSRPDPLWAAAIRPLVLGGIALCLGLSGSALLGQLMGALAAADAVVEAWQFFKREQVWRKSDNVVWTVAVGGLLLNAFFYSNLGPLPAILLIATLLLLAANRDGAPAFLRLACLLPLAVAMSIVLYNELNQPESEYDYYDYGAMRQATDRAVERA